MGDDHSNGRTSSDTLEILEAEREDLEKTVACVRQMAQDFDTLTERRKSFDAKRVAFHLQLKGPHLRRCVWKGIITPEAFQWHKAAIARKKALGDQMLQDTATFAQALIRWAEDLEKREKDYRTRAGQQQEPVLLSSPSIPIVTGGNGLMPDELDDSAAPGNQSPEELIRQGQKLEKRGQGPISTAQQQNAATEDMMRIDPPIASDPISESLTLTNLAGIPAMAEGVGSLVAAGTRELTGLASNAVGGLTEAVEQRLVGGAASRVVPGGGLQASENLGGHLLFRHVGRTEVQLMSRAMTDASTRGVASAFFDRATAEAAASQAIDANASNISTWLAGNSPRLRIFGTMSTNIGIVVTSEGVSAATRLSRFMLVRDATSSIGYDVLTGYPY